MSYTVKCTWSAGGGVTLYTFPAGCRVSGGSITRRTNLVAIPYADGEKDTADGKLSGGDVTVSGRIWASSGAAAIAIVAAMETLVTATAPFYVWADWDSGSPTSYPVTCCKSVAHTTVEGTGGLWIDVNCVFARGPDPAMV